MKKGRIRSIRVRTINAERWVAVLTGAGYTARFLGPGTAFTGLCGGCSDPEHCAQHDSHYSPSDWGSLEVNTSGKEAHRLWVAATGNLDNERLD